jgi:hypothetical protein
MFSNSGSIRTDKVSGNGRVNLAVLLLESECLSLVKVCAREGEGEYEKSKLFGFDNIDRCTEHREWWSK